MGNAGANTTTRIVELLTAYCDADYRWELEGEWHPLVVGQPTHRLEQAFPQARRFGLLSAWNPQSVTLPDAINRAADEMLHAALLESGLAFRPGFAAARNRNWREPSWLVMDMALPAFDALTRRFGQLGTLCWRRGEPIRLRMHAARPAEVAPHDQIDWLGAVARGDQQFG
ncbi:MAG TPA: DUF3293 domain-containing protein [Xanthomonadaceae bacterium]|nr:DUF3293 domain-containing protein [Xanthomonadaceae bacterium]